jgi:hypothetical protein
MSQNDKLKIMKNDDLSSYHVFMYPTGILSTQYAHRIFPNPIFENIWLGKKVQFVKKSMRVLCFFLFMLIYKSLIEKKLRRKSF